ncbi:unnamed protein product [Brassica rapa subsp. narinosa]
MFFFFLVSSYFTRSLSEIQPMSFLQRLIYTKTNFLCKFDVLVSTKANFYKD